MKKQEQKQKQQIIEFNENVVSFNGNIRLSDQYGEVLHQQPMNSLLKNYMSGMAVLMFGSNYTQIDTSGQPLNEGKVGFKLKNTQGLILGSGSDEKFKMTNFSPPSNSNSLYKQGNVFFSYTTQSGIKRLSFGKRFTSSSNTSPPMFNDIGLLCMSKDQDKFILLSHDRLPETFYLYQDRALDVTITLESEDPEINNNFFKFLTFAHTYNNGQKHRYINTNGVSVANSLYYSVYGSSNDMAKGLLVGSSSDLTETNSLKTPFNDNDLKLSAMSITTRSLEGGGGQYIRLSRTFTRDNLHSSATIRQIALYATSGSNTIMLYKKDLPTHPIIVPPNSSVVINLNFLFPFGSGGAIEGFGTDYGGDGFTSFD